MQKKFFQFDKLYSGNEELLVASNDEVFGHGQWQGFLIGDWGRYFSELIENDPQWMARDEAEANLLFQQIIPWTIFRYRGQYLELKRGAEGSHTRLYHRYTMGVGGHCYKDEYDKAGSLGEWVKAKFVDEVRYEGNLEVRPIGVVNDNADELGRLHFGIVYLLEGDSDRISVKKHLEHRLLPLSEISGEDVQFLDRWSQMVYRQLRDFEVDGVDF